MTTERLNSLQERRQHGIQAKRRTQATGHTGAADALWDALVEFEADVTSMEGYKPSVFRLVDRLKRSLTAGRIRNQQAEPAVDAHLDDDSILERDGEELQ